ncbi:MAG: cytochrome P450 [Acidimicrobiia bacterium]
MDTVLPDPMAMLFSPGGADDPHHAYRELRDQCPVARNEFAGTPSVSLSRYEDVLWAMRHPEVFSSDAEAMVLGEQPLIPLQVDPPQHTRYRRLLNPEFLPRTVARIEPDVRVLVGQLVDAFADRGHCDFHEEFATPLPSTIFLRLMGLPQRDLATFLQWRDDTVRPDVEPGDFEAAARVRAETSRAINAYFEDALEDRRRRPDDGLLSQLATAEVDGVRLSQRELLGICHLMLIGGLDTVTATLDCIIVYLARHPDRRRAIVADPSLLPSAIEELLRRETPVMVVPRIVKQDVTLRGVELHTGDRVTLLLGAANTDDAEFTDAEGVEFARDPNKHVAFGGGHHLCLGAHLARLELRVGLEEFHRRIPDYRIAEGSEIHFSPGIRQADRLPLLFAPAGEQT